MGDRENVEGRLRRGECEMSEGSYGKRRKNVLKKRKKNFAERELLNTERKL